jgi:hypothetical protein
LNAVGLEIEFAADVDVGRSGVHGPSGDETAFDQFVRIATHDLAVFACAWFTLVSVYDEITWSGVLFVFRVAVKMLRFERALPRVFLPVWFIHKAPFETI